MVNLFSNTDKSNYQFMPTKSLLNLSHYKLLQIIASINKKAKKEIIHFGVKKDYSIENIKHYPSKTKG